MGNTNYPQPIETSIAQFSRLPGLGRRTAERLVLALLEWPEAAAIEFAECIKRLQTEIHPCVECGNFAEASHCIICANPRRNKEQICIVEDATQIPVIEKAGCFEGVYHVLGGRLMPLEGVGPEDLNIKTLRQRIARTKVQELIIATGSDVEGEATAAFLIQEFDHPDIQISRIASGIPVGADITYADSATISIAMNKRSRLK